MSDGAQFRRRMRPLLGTYVDIGLSLDGNQSADLTIAHAFEIIQGIQSRLSRYDSASELSYLNQNRGRPIRMHPESIVVLRLARWITKKSQELFDCGLGQLQIRGRTVILPEGPLVTLDGIAKGFAVDRAIRALRHSGATRGWVNAGGDMKVFGDLDLPVLRRGPGGYEPIGTLRNAAVATSEVFDQNISQFPGKIVRSHEGEPPASGQWTILANNAWLADALTKVACLARPLERARRIEQLGGRWIDVDEVSA